MSTCFGLSDFVLERIELKYPVDIFKIYIYDNYASSILQVTTGNEFATRANHIQSDTKFNL